MGLIFKIKEWLALRRAKTEEEKEIPTSKDIKAQHKEFVKQSKKLKSMITKKKQTKNI